MCCRWQGRCSKDPNQRTVTVTITDVCPECESDHIDMQALTFNKVRAEPHAPASQCSPSKHELAACKGSAWTGPACTALAAFTRIHRSVFCVLGMLATGSRLCGGKGSLIRLGHDGRAQIAPMEGGRINVQYRRVECTPPEPLKVNIHANVGVGGWLRIAVEVCSIPTVVIL